MNEIKMARRLLTATVRPKACCTAHNLRSATLIAKTFCFRVRQSTPFCPALRSTCIHRLKLPGNVHAESEEHAVIVRKQSVEPSGVEHVVLRSHTNPPGDYSRRPWGRFPQSSFRIVDSARNASASVPIRHIPPPHRGDSGLMAQRSFSRP